MELRRASCVRRGGKVKAVTGRGNLKGRPVRITAAHRYFLNVGFDGLGKSRAFSSRPGSTGGSLWRHGAQTSPKNLKRTCRPLICACPPASRIPFSSANWFTRSIAPLPMQRSCSVEDRHP